MSGIVKTPDNSHLNDGKRKFHYFRDFSMSKRGAPKVYNLEEDFPREMSNSKNSEKLSNSEKKQKYEDPKTPMSSGQGLNRDPIDSEDEENFQMQGDLQIPIQGTKAIQAQDEGATSILKEITHVNEGIRELVLTEPDKVSCWEKFTEKSYQDFRKGWLHYVQNNGFRNIKELATIQCKFQSAICLMICMKNQIQIS